MNKTRTGQNKTLYVTAADMEDYEDAALLLGGDSLSKFIPVLLRQWLHNIDPTGERRKAIRKIRKAINEQAEA